MCSSIMGSLKKMKVEGHQVPERRNRKPIIQRRRPAHGTITRSFPNPAMPEERLFVRMSFSTKFRRTDEPEIGTAAGGGTTIRDIGICQRLLASHIGAPQNTHSRRLKA
jgi:hypothetical protein